MRRAVSAAALVLAFSGRATAAPKLEWLAPDDVAVSRVDVVRTPPAPLDALPPGENAYRVRVTVDGGAPVVRVRSVASDRSELGSLIPTMTPCRSGVAGCFESAPLRFATEAADVNHAASRGRSLRVRLGATVEAVLGSDVASVPVLGPRVTSIGAIEPHSARLRVLVARQSKKGLPAFGMTPELAILIAKKQVERADAVWAACGIRFDAEVQLFDPPSGNALAVGCEIGARARERGHLDLVVDGRPVSSTFDAGATPREAARRLLAAVVDAGFRADLHDNRESGPSGEPTTDVVVFDKAGKPAQVSKAGSSDDTLTLCPMSFDGRGGLVHFTDVDAVPGTLGERALLRAVDDGDPSTIELVIVPSFATAGRIGESFIPSDDGTAIRAIIEDRAGVRADLVSFALAHELGHVLLDVPGHTDDHGTDTPTRLMDSDAADPSAFGPRRLSVDECVRAFRSSGAKSRSPVLFPVVAAKKKRAR